MRYLDSGLMPELAAPADLPGILDSIEAQIASHDFVIVDTNFFNYLFRFTNKRVLFPNGKGKGVNDEYGLALMAQKVDSGGSKFDLEGFISGQVGYLFSLHQLLGSDKVVLTSPIDSELRRKARYFFSFGPVSVENEMMQNPKVGYQRQVVRMFREAALMIEDFLGNHDTFEYSCSADESIVQLAKRLPQSVVLSKDSGIHQALKSQNVVCDAATIYATGFAKAYQGII